MARRQLIPKSRLRSGNHHKVDSVAERRRENTPNKNMDLLIRCQILWENLSEPRREGARIIRYVNGDQWSDYITYKYNGNTVTTTEAEYIKRQGNIPLVQNVMHHLVSTVVGVYTKSETEPVATARDRDEQKVGEMMSITLQCNWQMNKMPLRLSILFEDYLERGMVFERESPDFKGGRYDIFSSTPNSSNMFWDGPMNDPTFDDLYLIGEMHDLTRKEVFYRFSHSKEDHKMLENIYGRRTTDYPASINMNDKHRADEMTFWSPSDPNMCRVYEIWTRELKSRYRVHDPLEGRIYRVELEEFHELVELENENRLREGLANGMNEEEIPLIEYEGNGLGYIEDYYWFFQYLAPDGTVLLEGESPFDHEGHPYTMSVYPFINGEIHPFAGYFLDQQRVINRYFIMHDMVLRSGAKGVTMVPKSALGGLTEEEFAEQWSSYNGIIFYTPKPGMPEPQQFYGSTANLGTIEMVQLMINLMEQASQTNNALMGKQPYAGTSAALYSQQTANATTSLTSLLLRFTAFVESIAVKKTKLIQQYYDEPRIINIAGQNYAGVKEYDPEKARDIEFDLSIKESAATPAHRMLANDMLMQFWQAGAINLEQMLQAGEFPFADQLLQSLGAAKEQAEQTGSPAPLEIPEETRRKISGLANQNAVKAAQSMLLGS